MKQFFILLVVFSFVLFLWLTSDQFSYTKDKYLSKKVLEYSMPLDVKIDTDLLNSLKPANNE
jgi:hypothetical protein